MKHPDSYLMSCYKHDQRELKTLINNTENPVKRGLYRKKLEEIRRYMRELKTLNSEYRRLSDVAPLKIVQIY